MGGSGWGWRGWVCGPHLKKEGNVRYGTEEDDSGRGLNGEIPSDRFDRDRYWCGS